MSDQEPHKPHQHYRQINQKDDLGTPPGNFPKAAMAVGPVASIARGPSLNLILSLSFRGRVGGTASGFSELTSPP